MSFAAIAMTMLLGSSMVIAFVLQPPKEQPAASTNAEASHHRCHGESLQSIRKSLLSDLNLQAEPQLPAGGLDSVRVQWKSTFSTTFQRAKDTEVAEVSGYSVSPDSGNSTNPKCCSVATEISIKDLGWDNWVIHPDSLTIVQCAPCHTDVTTVQCPSSQKDVHDPSSQGQVPCCQPTAQKMVPILYMDEFNALVISSVQLTLSCGCGRENNQQPGEE
ncbi:gonadal somatic cell derived factor isoform X2 [Channa argus]|uniref:gonadal somatic cell derived factor isoform X2 n=1 Tax=Channa argus TaxID=215402 RepID=UPI003520EB79